MYIGARKHFESLTEFHYLFIVVFDTCVFAYSLKISCLYMRIWRMFFVKLREFKKPWNSLLLCRVPYLILHSSLVFTRCQHCLPAFTAAFHRRCQKSFLLNKNIATAFADNFHYELVVLKDLWRNGRNTLKIDHWPQTEEMTRCDIFHSSWKNSVNSVLCFILRYILSSQNL